MGHTSPMNEEIIMNEIINFIENTDGSTLAQLIFCLFIFGPPLGYAVVHTVWLMLSPKKRAAIRQAEEEEMRQRAENNDPMKFIGPPTRTTKIMRDTDWSEVALGVGVASIYLYGKTIEKTMQVGNEMTPTLVKGGVVVALIEMTGGV